MTHEPKVAAQRDELRIRPAAQTLQLNRHDATVVLDAAAADQAAEEAVTIPNAATTKTETIFSARIMASSLYARTCQCLPQPSAPVHRKSA